jgi:pilus assembly protein Flp/PilA
MQNLKHIMKNLVVEDSGQDLIEYALVAALVGLGVVASMKSLSTAIGSAFNTVTASLTGKI